LVFREFTLRVRLLANIMGGAPHSRSESGNHRISFLTGYSFLRRAFCQKWDGLSRKQKKVSASHS